MKDSAYDHHSAIYHLLLDKLKKHPKTIMNKLPNIGVPNLPMATRTERRSSITTGVGKSLFYGFCPLVGVLVKKKKASAQDQILGKS